MLSSVTLPSVKDPICLSELPRLLGPYAKTAPIYVYLSNYGKLQASRFRRGDEEELMLILRPKGSFSLS